MKVFIVMPFASQYNRVYSAIKKACEKADVMHLRADEIKQPGPIINQIFRSITNADCIIAEVSDKNPNVYYEVAVAHCVGKPTILLARKETVRNLPFDIRHHRVLLYDEKNLSDMLRNLIEHLIYLKTSTISGEAFSTVETYLDNLSLRREKPETLLNEIQNHIAEEFGLTDVRLVEKKVTAEGIIITVEDAFGEKVTALMDINGIIKRMRRMTK